MKTLKKIKAVTLNLSAKQAGIRSDSSKNMNMPEKIFTFYTLDAEKVYTFTTL